MWNNLEPTKARLFLLAVQSLYETGASWIESGNANLQGRSVMAHTKIIVVSLALLSGCTASQLRYETLNQAGTVESITEKQIFFNLEQFDKNPYAFPSQVTVIAGSASTTNSVSPTFMTPLGMATTVTSQFADAATSSVATALASTTADSVAGAVANGTSNTTTGTTGSTVTTGTTNVVTSGGPNTTTAAGTSGSVANSTSTAVANGTTGSTTTTTTKGTTTGNTTTGTTGRTGTITNSSASTRPNRTLSLALSDNWMESWTLDPVVNPDVLRRLSALYRYVLGETRAVDQGLDNPDRDLKRPAFRAWAKQHQNAIEDQFMCEYAMPPAAAASGGDSSATTTTTITEGQPGGNVTTTTTTGPEKPAGNDDQSVTLVFKCLSERQTTYRKRAVKVKRSTLVLPGCVICLDKPVPSETDPNVVAAYKSKEGDVLGDDPQPYVNPNLPFGLITRARTADPGKNNVHIGRAFYGDVDVDPNVHLDFHEFELLVNAATIVDTAASGTTGGGKGGNPKVLALPVSPNGFLLK
jgi:hypothetical protein